MVPGTVAGVLALAAVVGFGVGLPELTESAADETEAEERTPAAELLPDQLPGGLMPIGDVAPENAEMVAGFETFADERIADVFGADAAVRHYGSADRMQAASLTIIDLEPGLFQPAGPPQDPELLGVEVADKELQRIGDATCWIIWGSPEQAQTGQPVAVDCQQGADGRTFDLYTIGMSPEATAEALDGAVAAAG